MITLRDMPGASDLLHDLSRVFAPASRVPHVELVKHIAEDLSHGTFDA